MSLAQDLARLGFIYNDLAGMVTRYREGGAVKFAALNRSLMEAKSWVATAEVNLKEIIDREEAARKPSV